MPADYEMDPRVVNSTLPGYSVREALLDIPTMCVSMAPDDFISEETGIYANPQSRWERPCSIEYILPDGREGFQYDCKIEVHGNAQDQLGQIMASGKLVVHGDVGQTFMYGAKGGEAYIMGNAAGQCSQNLHFFRPLEAFLEFSARFLRLPAGGCQLVIGATQGFRGLVQ